MTKVDIAGLKIDALTKQELLAQLKKNTTDGKKTWVTTPYSEFLLAALRDPSVMQMLNEADIAVPDGIGMFWAKRFLELPFTAKNYWIKILQAYWQAFYTLCAIIIRPSYVRSAMPEKISGSDLIFDLAKLAADHDLSIYLLGGFGDTPELAAQKLLSSFLSGRTKMTRANIAGWSNKNPDNPSVIDDIKKANPDILLVAYGPIKQERWITARLQELPVKLVIGLGGTFDYLAGKVPNPPRFLRKIGLEWLWRLFTQPHRAGRIYNAFFGFINALIHYKVFLNLPFRPNVVSVVFNSKNEVLVALRSPNDKDLHATGDYEEVKKKNYWQFSQGGIDPGEDLIETARRELQEELSIKNAQLIMPSPHTTSYHWKNAVRPFLFNKYHYKGQEQQVVYFRFTGSDEEIKVDNKEFMDFKWINTDQLKNVVHTAKHHLVNVVLADLKEMQEKRII